VRRGEIWWANLPPPMGRRPVVLLSREEAYHVRQFLIMSPVTSQERQLRTEVVLDEHDGLPHRSVVNLDVLVTQRKTHLDRRIGQVPDSKLNAIDEALRFALGLA